MPITNHIYYKITCDISKLFEGLVNQNSMEMAFLMEETIDTYEF